MGQKVDPRGFRVWFTRDWPCEWFAKTKQQAAQFAIEDIKIRQFIDEYYKRSGIGKVVIRKFNDKPEGEIILFTSKPALVIWKEGKKLKDFEKKLEDKFGRKFTIRVKEIKIPELSAKIMAEYIAAQLEKRMPHRRVAKSALQKIMDKWAIWAKIQLWWRLGGVDMARVEKFIKWRVPLQTLRADIDYHYTTALTKYWILGVKVWIYKGDFLDRFAKKKQIRKKISKAKTK